MSKPPFFGTWPPVDQNSDYAAALLHEHEEEAARTLRAKPVAEPKREVTVVRSTRAMPERKR